MVGAAYALTGVELHTEASEELGEGDVWTHGRDDSGITHGNVDRELDELAVAEGRELPRDVDRDVHLRLGGVRAEMRGRDDARMLDQPPQ